MVSTAREIRTVVGEFNRLAALEERDIDFVAAKRRMYDFLVNLDPETWKDFRGLCELDPGAFDTDVTDILRLYYHPNLGREDTYSRLREVASLLLLETSSVPEPN